MIPSGMLGPRRCTNARVALCLHSRRTPHSWIVRSADERTPWGQRRAVRHAQVGSGRVAKVRAGRGLFVRSGRVARVQVSLPE